MHTDRDLAVFDEMERVGGGFVVALAIAWRKADAINSAKLRSQFSGYYQQYEDALVRAGKLPAMHLASERRA